MASSLKSKIKNSMIGEEAPVNWATAVAGGAMFGYISNYIAWQVIAISYGIFLVSYCIALFVGVGIRDLIKTKRGKS